LSVARGNRAREDGDERAIDGDQHQLLVVLGGSAVDVGRADHHGHAVAAMIFAHVIEGRRSRPGRRR
jgi:hypothetical protein